MGRSSRVISNPVCHSRLQFLKEKQNDFGALSVLGAINPPIVVTVAVHLHIVLDRRIQVPRKLVFHLANTPFHFQLPAQVVITGEEWVTQDINIPLYQIVVPAGPPTAMPIVAGVFKNTLYRGHLNEAKLILLQGNAVIRPVVQNVQAFSRFHSENLPMV